MRYDVIVIGSGAAAYSAADWLHKFGITDIALVTEGKDFGTSRNTGSDKQTYYKLSLDGNTKDCARMMAEDIAAGGACDGELAYIEAANSTRCFFRLVEYGIDFPFDEHGGYAGYRTDHDNTKRATSIGPLTSREITEKLEYKVLKINGTTLIDNSLVIKIITDNGEARGVIVYDKKEKELKSILAGAVIAACGAPASVYSQSVYPLSQHGMTGVLVKAGVALVNFSEWQYGLASVKFRWNMSGSYMQAIPRFYSVDENGNKYDFLEKAIGAQALQEVFLKGYQWPFDFNKIASSSRVDLAVQKEINKGRRVFLDYKNNPKGFSSAALSYEAYNYLANSNALGNTPFERLNQLNKKAIKVFLDNGIDLSCEPLEIAVCAQHNNGGVLVDTNYMSDIKNLFVIGEAAGVFGITRQGGTALNSTQVGGLRAALYLKKNTPSKPVTNYHNVLEREQDKLSAVKIGIKKDYTNIKIRMSRYAGFLRDESEMHRLLEDINSALDNNTSHVSQEAYYLDSDMLLSAKCLIDCILGTMKYCGSRGGAVYIKNGIWVPENTQYHNQRAVYKDKTITFIKTKPVPQTSVWFEELLSQKE